MEPGDTFEGTYRIISELGRGAHATVFLGEHLEIGQRVAIKLVRTHSERFKREGRVLAQLSSPHTVRLLSFGRTKDDEQYLISEWVDGESLTEFVNRRAPVHWQLVVDIVRQILEALDEAHGLDIIHRDIKPGNVMLIGESEVKVLDFGVAKLMTDPTITATHEVLGTPRYMAPETLLGDPVTPAADIFAVGMLAFSMLTGRHANDARGDVQAIVARHLRGAPYEVPADVIMPRGARVWLNSMMARNPSNRPVNAGEALRSLNLEEDAPTMQTPAVAVGIRNPAGSEKPTEVHRAILVRPIEAPNADDATISGPLEARPLRPDMLPRIQPTPAPPPANPGPRAKPAEDRPALNQIQAPTQPNKTSPAKQILPLLAMLAAIVLVVVVVLGILIGGVLRPESPPPETDPKPVPTKPVAVAPPEEDDSSTEFKQLSKRGIAHFEKGEMIEALQIFARIEQGADLVDKAALNSGNYAERAIQQVLEKSRSASASAKTVEDYDAAAHDLMIVHSLYRAHPDVNAEIAKLRKAARKIKGAAK